MVTFEEFFKILKRSLWYANVNYVVARTWNSNEIDAVMVYKPPKEWDRVLVVALDQLVCDTRNAMLDELKMFMPEKKFKQFEKHCEDVLPRPILQAHASILNTEQDEMAVAK